MKEEESFIYFKVDPEKQKQLVEAFSPKGLFDTFKKQWHMVLIWACFFGLGFFIASQYYQVAANNFIAQYCADNNYNIGNITLNVIDGTIFGG